MRKNHSEIVLVLDRSGSMENIATDTIGGYNTFLKKQQEAPGTATFTLYQFDDRFETAVDAKDIQSVPMLNKDTFVPRGATALLDAIGRAIMLTGRRLENTPEDARAEKVVIVILTDGLENASRESTKEKVFEMIEHQRSKYSWEFVFLGANQDAIATAAGIGIAGANTITYMANSIGTRGVFNSTADNLCSYRAGNTTSAAYSKSDRDIQTAAGATIGKTTKIVAVADENIYS